MHAPETSPAGELPRIAAELLTRLRQRRPRVHCITNTVAQNFTANMLLAAGVVPSMTISPEEIAQFTAGADALLVNLGTLDAGRREAIDIAVETAAQFEVPWALDPVFIDRTPPRNEFARELVTRRPLVVRLNRAEFTALSDLEPGAEALSRYAADRGVVVALSGETDLITDGERTAAVANGDALMSRVTAMGCAGSALLAACLAVELDPWRASGAALILLGVAGELAAQTARGPGSFAVAILDAVHGLDDKTVIARARVT